MKWWPRLGGVTTPFSPDIQRLGFLPLYDVARAFTIRPRLPAPQAAFSVANDPALPQLDVHELMRRLAAPVNRQGDGTPQSVDGSLALCLHFAPYVRRQCPSDNLHPA